jgi:hypothetical protein
MNITAIRNGSAIMKNPLQLASTLKMTVAFPSDTLIYNHTARDKNPEYQNLNTKHCENFSSYTTHLVFTAPAFKQQSN